MGSGEFIVGLYVKVNESNKCASQNGIYLPRFFLRRRTQCTRATPEVDQQQPKTT